MSDWEYSVLFLGFVNKKTGEFNERHPEKDPLAGPNQPKAYVYGLTQDERIRQFKEMKRSRKRKKNA